MDKRGQEIDVTNNTERNRIIDQFSNRDILEANEIAKDV